MAQENHIGKIIDSKYRIVKLLGKGGMGAVYAAEHIVLGKLVAIKMLHKEYTKKKSLMTRFCREAQAAIEIDHPNVAEVMDIGTLKNGAPYLIIEYLEGEPLAALLKRVRKMSFGAACGILEPVLLALHAAHCKGIVHRDLKPDNIFLCYRNGVAPTVKLIDFGISKFTNHEDMKHLTASGDILGTPSYMSPEQIRGLSTIDSKSDLFSVGVITFEMLRGCRPFPGYSSADIISAILAKDAPGLSKHVDGVPNEIEKLVKKLLNKDSNYRPDSALAVLEQLKKQSVFSRRAELLAACCNSFIINAARNPNNNSLSKKDVAVEKKFNSSKKADANEGLLSTGAMKSAARKQKLKKYAVVSGLLIALSVTLFVITLYINFKRWNTTVQSSNINVSKNTAMTTQEAPKEETVSIELRGVPKDATITYKNSTVLFSKFKAPKENRPVPIKVTANGYASFDTFIIPSQNQIVQVTLKPTKFDKNLTEKATSSLPPKRTSTSAPKKNNQRSRLKKVHKAKGLAPNGRTIDFEYH